MPSYSTHVLEPLERALQATQARLPGADLEIEVALAVAGLGGPQR